MTVFNKTDEISYIHREQALDLLCKHFSPAFSRPQIDAEISDFIDALARKFVVEAFAPTDEVVMLRQIIKQIDGTGELLDREEEEDVSS